MKCLVLFGTRPEAIKLAPLISSLKKNKKFSVLVGNSGQHRDLLDHVIDFFQLNIDFHFDVMKPGQSLAELTSKCLLQFQHILEQHKPDLVVVQGDTTTCMTGALAAFYEKIPVAHVEAGLRSGDIYSPWPEEVNRKIVSNFSNLHLAPTIRARENLLRENVSKENISVTGNTGIDALFLALEIIKNNPQLEKKISEKFSFIQKSKKIILATLHRRESFGSGLDGILQALAKFSQRDDVQIVLPVHPNPAVGQAVNKIRSESKNFIFLDPLEYPDFVYLMNRSYFILTDSGGVQEEAPSLGKPVLVARENTERPEAIEAGTSRLVGTNSEIIFKALEEMMENKIIYESMAHAKNPFGDGQACKRIEEIFLDWADRN